ncbi:hypothetical protein PuT2_05640 [Pusillimonas sp. T2]|uniref:acyltransferase family protein n=1 Tax=Pusillimonas sp. T2 TaxID=1548123 RepID=UPI000B946559|nr:acyltransferase family protein [Pusillimonas sp. T2]OXR50240.1 hypothetical protein PuT2_05640 [Pusillimonas sp. T2]
MRSAVLKYRPEIDGLRAIAVLSVILFHAGMPGLSGGFVGVDVFFVISGYLITGILLRELASGEFSIAKFYERRIRRIFPALFFVLLVCLPFGWFLMDPYALWRLGQGMVSVTLFVSNILYWQTTNYFTAALESPLLHTWSLGVEEQFYIFFPFFLGFVWRYARPWLLGAIIFVALISLGISQWGVQTGRVVAAFYLLPSRAFELLLGALVAVIAANVQPSKTPSLVAELMSWVGMGAIAWAIVLFDQATPFPGWRALIPSVGAALLLAFLRSEGVLGRMLSFRGLVGIGLISYSAYLWHQPLFAYAHIIGGQLGHISSFLLVLGSLGLAALSWKYVELPFRNPGFLTRSAVFSLAALSSAVALSVGGALVLTQGVSSRFTDEELRWWRFADIGLQSNYVSSRFGGLQQGFVSDSRRKVLILGDSFAEDFVNVIYESGRWEDAQIRTVYIPAVCQIVDVEQSVIQYIAVVDRPACARNPTVRSSKALVEQADIVILAASWSKWAAELLPETIEKMSLESDQRLFVIGPKSFGTVNIAELLALGEVSRGSIRHQPSAEILEVNRILGEGVRPESFVDQIATICGDDFKCPVVTPDDELISYDGSHLTKEGAKYIGRRLFDASVLATAN